MKIRVVIDENSNHNFKTFIDYIWNYFLIYRFPPEDSFLKNVKMGNTNFRWKMNVGWHRTTCLLPFTCTDCALKNEDMKLVAKNIATVKSSTFSRPTLAEVTKTKLN
ncbi:hypothetical protein [Bacillus cereus]|uniref:hypothetical protein n=1 Tax=Bacillus cereus TaxID=1396 RepID=UPI0015CF5C39|nr:hypothetical protein [Bacillus cereus]